MPDGVNPGSGLNIFVGENNTGKSTVFEAIDFLRDNTKKDLSRIKNKRSKDDDEMSVELTFSNQVANTISEFSQTNKKDIFNKYVFSKDGTEHLKIIRSSKDPKAVQLWDQTESQYKNEIGIDAPLKKLFETNFVWSDTNPNDQTSFGSTTICGNLLKEIITSFENTSDYINFSGEFHKTFNDEKSGLRKELKEIEARTQKIFSEQFSDAKITFRFDELKIDAFFKNTKIEVDDDGVSTYMEEKGSGMQRSIALALLQVYAEELIKHPQKIGTEKPFFLFIDEPEICLHPLAQLKLLRALLELSKKKQIFIATHSPYFFKNTLINNAGLLLFTKDPALGIKIANTREQSWGLFPWSPSWGEINFRAYNLPTVEFHNELYGYLQEKSGKKSIKDFDSYLQSDRNITDMKPYTQDGITNQVTLCTYIRHKIHHPENTDNPQYSEKELKDSIVLLIQNL